MSTDKKTIIIDALQELMNEKSIDKITVKNIVEKCDITRQTFYYHFQDMMEVIEVALDREMKMIFEDTIKVNKRKEAIEVLVTSVAKHIVLIRRLLVSSRRDQTERLLISTLKDYINEFIEIKEALPNISRTDMAFVLDFYSYAIYGILLQQKDFKPASVKELVNRIDKIISGEMIHFPDEF